MDEQRESSPAAPAPIPAPAPIREVDARRHLELAGSPAANNVRYQATRHQHGWLFGFRRGNSPVLMGTRSWVVADNGRVRMLSPGELADAVLRSEIELEPDAPGGQR
ncbi:MAG: hypothetical protein WKF57_06520 [Nakamurella sp.]